MLFNSYEFLFLFLPLTFASYFYLVSRHKIIASKIALVIASLAFYAYWNVSYLFIIVASMLFNYCIGSTLSKHKSNDEFRSKKKLLTIGIIINLSVLGYFKYMDFFIENFNTLFQTNVGLLKLVLPLAISFFTFQQISYLVDSFKKETSEYSFLNYILFVTFFPQLIAGPIVHHKEMMPQFNDSDTNGLNFRNVSSAIFIFSIGLFKKVAIADTFAIWANAGFDVASSLNFIEAWSTSLSYTFQLYFDFSGYTDMAIGLALLFNIVLPINFNSPYKALSIQDFWRRWHMTLSRFLKDYIYIPLGGNKSGTFKTCVNLMATFVIGGIWHGAGWTFIFWGFLHGAALIVHRFWSQSGFRLWTWFSWFLTFNFVNIAWVFFRAQEWKDAVKVLVSMFSLNDIVLPFALEIRLSFLSNYGVKFGGFVEGINADKYILVWLCVGFLLSLACTNSIEKLKSFKPSYLNLYWVVIMIVYSLYCMLGLGSEFLYFNF